MGIINRIEEKRELKPLTTIGIGGQSRYFVVVKTIEEMQEILFFAFCSSIPCIVIGKGSNLLFDDKGFKGLVILNKISFCKIKKNRIYVGAGYSFSHLGILTANEGLGGLEFACGIPASVGGAVFMNAGANGQDISQVLTKVNFITKKGGKVIFEKNDLQFKYRFSSFHWMEGAIVAAEFLCSPSDIAKIKQKEMLNYRLQTQPTEKSAGSIFQNPVGISAGKLIEDCGLKGKAIGGAKVSNIHANFIINHDNATSEDVCLLIEFIQEKVLNETGIALETEVKYIPYELSEKNDI